MMSRRLGPSLIAALGACSGADMGEPAAGATAVRIKVEDTLVVLEVPPATCSAKGPLDPSKLSPAREALLTSLGSSRASFIVMLEGELDVRMYPLPSPRFEQDDPLLTARAAAISRLQGCTIRAIEREGGRYVESFFLINGLVAELTVEEAEAISSLSDVRSIELSDENSPPP